MPDNRPQDSFRQPTEADHGPMPLPDGRIPILALVTMPADANPGGSVFGGWIMSQIDIAGAVVANRRARGRVSTVAASAMTFHEPVRIGERVLFYADVIRTGTTSITTKVEVFVERNVYAPEVVKVSEATLTYVAIGPDRRPRPIDEPPAPQPEMI